MVVIIACMTFAAAQNVIDKDDTQSWNDLQLTVPITKQFDFYTALTARFGKNLT